MAHLIHVYVHVLLDKNLYEEHSPYKLLTVLYMYHV